MTEVGIQIVFPVVIMFGGLMIFERVVHAFTFPIRAIRAVTGT